MRLQSLRQFDIGDICAVDRLGSNGCCLGVFGTRYHDRVFFVSEKNLGCEDVGARIFRCGCALAGCLVLDAGRILGFLGGAKIGRDGVGQSKRFSA